MNKSAKEKTGFKDKTDKEIRLGDVVLIDNEDYPVITICKKEKGQFTLEDRGDGHWARQLYHQPDRLLVIANIINNPELSDWDELDKLTPKIKWFQKITNLFKK